MMDSLNPQHQQQQQKKNNRNSMLAYVPVHRRNEEDDVLSKRTTNNNNNNKYRSSIHVTPSSSSSSTFDLQVESSTSTKRSSLLANNRRPPSVNNNRYSRTSYMGDDDDYYDNENNEGSQEDWENILKQYDRYSSFTQGDDDKRKSKRASRTMDSYQDMPVQVPIVDEPTTVLDCYDFPPAFKTHHLHDIFRSYESVRGGYKIKWLSDTRALIIFDHPSTAKKAYIDNVTHALAKIRPYDGPTDFLKENNTQQANNGQGQQQQQQQSRHSRPMSVDIKRQSLNAYGAGSGNGGRSSRNSMRSESLLA